MAAFPPEPSSVRRKGAGSSDAGPSFAGTQGDGERAAREQALRETRISRVCASDNVEFPQREIRDRAHEREAKVVKARAAMGLPIKDESVDELLERFGTQQFQAHAIALHHTLKLALDLPGRLRPVPVPNLARQIQELERSEIKQPLHPRKNPPGAPVDHVPSHDPAT